MLERALTDFGADVSFAKASVKVKEHYGIDLGASRARRVTLAHARQVRAQPPPVAPAAVVAQLIGQMDGSMVPLVEHPPVEPGMPADRRKTKRLFWQEARLCSARADGSVTPTYGVTMGSVLEAGLPWHAVAQLAGLGPHTRVHGVGDGAEWIAEQFERQFGAHGYYLIDFYHVSEYLAAAAPVEPTGPSATWRHQQQQRLKANESSAVIQELAARCEPAAVAAAAAPVRAAHRYLVNRQNHLDYQGTLAAGLPIGSGEVEGGHRHVLQARLKLSGAWWAETNAYDMMALRVLCANGHWNAYWQSGNLQKN